MYDNIAAEEKARATYQWMIDLSDDPDLNDSLRFLREREIIHSQRFREAHEILNLNHVFMNSVYGNIMKIKKENAIPQKVDQQVINDMAEWILSN